MLGNDRDSDGYTARSFEDLIRDPPTSDRDPVTLDEAASPLVEKYGGGATWPQAAPTSIPGAAPFWIERWNAMWGLLSTAGYIQRAQGDRFREMRDIARNLRGNAQADPRMADQLRRLGNAAKRPTTNGAPSLPLWAVTTEVGLLMVHGDPEEMQSLVDTRCVASLRHIPRQTLALFRIDAALQIPVEEVAYWSWAAAQIGILFHLPIVAMDEPATAGPAGARPASVVRPDPPQAGRRSR